MGGHEAGAVGHTDRRCCPRRVVLTILHSPHRKQYAVLNGLFFLGGVPWLHSLTARSVLVGRRCVVVMFGTDNMDTKTLEHHGLEHFDKALRGSLHLEVTCKEHIHASCRVSGPVGV